MDDIRLFQGPHDQNVTEKSVQEPLMADILGRKIEIEMNAFYRHITGMFILFTEAIDIHLMFAARLASELSREILDVNTRSSVNMRRIFICQESNFHGIPS
jgi:hypothetical protein